MNRRDGRRGAWCVALGAVAVAGCLTQERRGQPLYPSSGAPRARAEIALLYGPVTAVDSQKLAGGGKTYELLPGCHIVEIGGKTGKVDPTAQGGWVASLPPLIYGFRMRAGHTYSIDAEIDPALGLGPNGSGRVVAREQDAVGHETVVPPAQSDAELAACQQWRP